MISVIVYGRNDSHGYNLPKRAALSFNCIAEVLTRPNDEIVFVDCNTPDDLPTFPESIADTLTPRAKQLLRILRLRPEQYERGKNGTKFKVLEPLCRNVGIRRTNPQNRWILNTNTDMVFAPLPDGQSLSDVVAGLPDGFYELPRFEMPEILWETSDRFDPQAIIRSFKHWGRRLHINEMVANMPEIRFDGPGDFQLALREQLFQIHGMDERMTLGWHVDSNLCKRMFLLNGQTRSLLDKVWAYHCDHTRLNTPYHSVGESTQNDLQTFFSDVKTSGVPEQARSWGMPAEQVEDFHLTDERTGRYSRTLEQLVPGLSELMVQTAMVEGSFNHGLLYDTQHALAYVTDHLTMMSPATDIGYFGGNVELLRLVAAFRHGYGHTGRIFYDEAMLITAQAQSLDNLPPGCQAARADQIFSQASLCCFDAWMGHFPIHTNPQGYTVPLPSIAAADFGIQLLKRCVEFARLEKARCGAPGILPRKSLFFGTQHTWFEGAPAQLFGLVMTPFSSYVRHGFVRRDALTRPLEPLHGMGLLFRTGEPAERLELARQMLPQAAETTFLQAEMLARRIAADLSYPSSSLEEAFDEPAIMLAHCVFLELELKLTYLRGDLTKADRIERVLAHWHRRSLPLDEMSETPVPAVPTATVCRRSRQVKVGIDARTFFYADSVSRGIGHYALNHLKHIIPLRPDWQFLLLVENDRPVPALKTLAVSPNVRICRLEECAVADLDLLHIPDPMNLGVGFDSPMRLYPGVPATAVFHDLTPLRHYWNTWPDAVRQAYLLRLRQLQQRNLHLLANSEYTRQDLLRATSFPPERASVIMAGLNRAEHPLEVTSKLAGEIKLKYQITQPFFLHVGALDPHKNFEAVIHAMGRLRSKDAIQLVVVGEKDHFLQQVANHCVEMKTKNIIFPGYIPRLDLEVLYHEAIALLFLSRYEGFGFPVLEAMAQGCPVITTNVTSIPEVAGDAALLFAPDDHAAISQGMQQLLTDRKLRETLCAKGRAQAAKFPWTKPAQKTIEVWERILGEIGSGTPTEPAKPNGENLEPEQIEQRQPEAFPPSVSAVNPNTVVAGSADVTPQPRLGTPRPAVPTDSTATSRLTLAIAQETSVLAPPVPPPSLPGLVWFAPWQNPSGYGSEALTFASALAPSVSLELVDVARVKSSAFVAGLPTGLRQLLQDHLRSSADTTDQLCLSHFPASGFAPLPTAAWNIGRTMFETDRLPQDWVTRCNQMDEIWVPSQFNLETFAQSGVARDKLQVIPGAVDPDQFDPARHTPLPLANRAAFNFLAVFEWSLRKGWDVLLAAYLREFSAADDVCLYLRTYLVNQPDADPAEIVRQLIREYAATLSLGNKSLPRIEILAQQIPSADLPRLYRAVDCLVAPSRGEGWGRPHHEAMLMELPVIATNWSGNTEFMTADNSLLLKFELVDVKVGSDLQHYRGHRWAEPNETHLRELMRLAQQDPAAAREIGRRARASVSARFSPAAAAQKIQQRLAAIQQRLTLPALPVATARTRSTDAAAPATQRPDVSVAWEGSFLDFGSLSHVNREFTRQLARSPGIQLTCVSPKGLSHDRAALAARQATAGQLKPQAPRQTQVTIRHAWPPNWAAPESGAWVLMQPWEFGVLPLDWVAQIEQVDEVWAYSEYVRRVYVDSGVPPGKVKVVPLGIDPQQFHPQVRPMVLATAKSFKFLFVGGTIGRKGPDLLLQSFLETFTSSDDVCLVIKDFGGKSVYAGQTMAAQVAAAQAKPNAPEIHYLNQEWAPEVMPSLYTACDCLVHSYRGEGFGLPVIEAMACGLPVIVTGGGATDDFASDEYAYRVAARRQALSMEIGGIKLGKRGWWLEPDVRVLAGQMRWVWEHPEQARAKGLAASEYVRREWTWERAASVAEARLRELIARPGVVDAKSKDSRVRQAAPITLPPCALLGQLGEARQFFNNKKLPAAWGAVRAALKHRPFHPEAYLLLAEIALAAHDAVAARACAQYARQIAPDFKPAKKFLKASLHGNLKPDWLVLPDVIRDPHTIRRPHLSVCLIVKNEERFLGQCLASVEGLADQIVVVDTGSTDRTVEIAKHHKAEVHSFTWCDDFSAARNAALEYVTGDWVLMLDADEELPPEQHEALRKLLRAAPVMAWRLPLQDVGREAEGVSYVPRLFRNAPALFFVGRVHEQVFTSIEVRRQEWGLETRLGDAMLRHYGYTKELTHERDKVGRNLRLLEKAVLETPGEANLLMNYGLELTRSGRPEEGLRQYRAAFEAMADEPTEVVVPETREMLLGQFCTQLMAAKAHAEIIRVLTSPLAKLGVGLTASLHFTLGLAQMELKEFALAAEQFRQCLAKRERPALTPVNVEIRKAGPRHCLALCLAQANEPVAAESEFQAARQDDAESAPVAADYARFLQETGRAVEGLQLLHQFTSEHPQAAVAWQVGGAIALSQPEFLEVAVDWTAEALRHFPEDVGIQSQRAEALLLAGQPEAALPLWQKFKASEQPVALAALILCETAVGKNEYAPSPELAGAVTQEFVNCYRRLLVCGAEPVVRRVNAGVDGLARVLPRAAELLRAVIAEANAPGA